MVSVPDMVAKFVELAGLDKISNKTVDTVRELTEFQDRAEDIGKAVFPLSKTKILLIGRESGLLSQA